MRLLADKRGTPRTPIFWPVSLIDGVQGVFKGRVVNATDPGLLIQTHQEWNIGEPLEMQMQVGPGCTIRCRGHILRKEPSPAHYYGFGEAYGHICYAIAVDSFYGDGYTIFQRLLQEIIQPAP